MANDLTPTRSAVVALKDERRTMREGYALLDEKCLLLAGAMLRELRQLDALGAALGPLQAQARWTLEAALGRHGLNELQCYPPPAGSRRVATGRRSLLGVVLQEAGLEGRPAAAEPAVNPSPEAEACRDAFARAIEHLVRMAAVSGNLVRLHAEYRRTVRRVRALSDVLLPDVDRTLYAMEASLEELEQDETLWMRSGGAQARPRA